MKQTFYDQNEKHSKLLTWQIKEAWLRAINLQRNEQGELTTDSREINDTFCFVLQNPL